MRDDRAGVPAGAPDIARRRLLLLAAGGVMVGLAASACRAGGAGASAGSGQTATAPSATASARSPRATASAAPRHHPRPAGRGKAVEAASRTSGASPRPPVYYVEDGPKVIALTIDDGPSPLYTPQVLRLLDRYKVKATFSMVGENVTDYPAIAREVAQAGHTIINHTWDHANLTRLSAARQEREIDRATVAIHQATGVLPRMFRAPYGAWSRESLDYCARERLVALDWSVDPRDWSRPGVSEIVRTIMRTTRTGSIILEHDGGGDRAQTVAALTVVIPRLLDEGYRFTIP